MTDYETVKSIFEKGGWDVKESTINQNDEEYPTLKKLTLGGYYGIEVLFKENGDIYVE